MLFSINGTHPHIFKQRSMSQNGKMLVQNIQLVLGLLYHVSISQNGGDHLCKECRHLEHDLILTRDRNKEFHIFQHTTRHSEMASTGSSMSDWHENCTCPLLLPTTQSSSGEGGLETSQQETVLWSDNSHHPYSSHLSLHSPLHVVQKHTPEHCTANPGQEGCKVQTMDKGYQLHPLHVASYNIWNVNSLSGVEESYDGRITRLGKVSGCIYLDIVSFILRPSHFHANRIITHKIFVWKPEGLGEDAKEGKENIKFHASKYYNRYIHVYSLLLLSPLVMDIRLSIVSL